MHCERASVEILPVSASYEHLTSTTSALCFACCVSYLDLFTARRLSDLKTRVPDGYEVHPEMYSMF